MSENELRLGATGSRGNKVHSWLVMCNYTVTTPYCCTNLVFFSLLFIFSQMCIMFSHCVFVMMHTAQFLSHRPDKDREGARSQKSCRSRYHAAAQRPQQQNHAGKVCFRHSVIKVALIQDFRSSSVPNEKLLSGNDPHVNCWFIDLDVTQFRMVPDQVLSLVPTAPAVHSQ